MKDSRWSIACMIRQRIVKWSCSPCQMQLWHSQLQSCIMHKELQEQMLREKTQMTLCSTTYIWPLPCKPDPVPLLWHINTALHYNFLPMQEQQAQRQKHWNNMKRKDRIVLPLDLFHHRKKWKLNLTKVKLLSGRLLMLNLFGTVHQVTRTCYRAAGVGSKECQGTSQLAGLMGWQRP